MLVAVTGHRPQNLPGGFKNKALHQIIRGRFKVFLEQRQSRVEIVYTGMALGFDQWAAEICIDLNIPFVAALPCKGQDRYWPTKSQERYKWLLSKAMEIVQVDRQDGYISTEVPPDVYHPNKMIVRNKWMIDQLNPANGDKLFALWNGSAKSGTGSTVKMANAKRAGMTVILDPENLCS